MDESFSFGPHRHRHADGRECKGTLRYYSVREKLVLIQRTSHVVTTASPFSNPDLMARCDECGIAGVLVER